MQADRIVGTHPIVRAIAEAAERLARSGDAVFVIGERGTGKELFARQLHAAGRRPDERFVRVDCAEASEERLAHELFERERGWERASGGTLLLDDLPSLPPELQRRLLDSFRQAAPDACRAAQLVASMDQAIALQRRSGRLDGELIDHLCPVEVALPALRQRRSDIPVLVEHFLALYAQRNGVPDCVIETEALVHLWQYDWPGNVRELESVIERVVVLCPRGVVRSTDLPASIRTGAGARGPSCRTASPPTGVGGPQLRSSF
jgi:DNA-binding NtrC family response regulator